MTERPTILVIEDNPVTRKMLRVVLETEGYAVTEAGDARNALALVDHRRPDLIVQDLILPDMDGVDLVRRLRAKPSLADVPILALSGFLARLDDPATAEAGFTALLVKPIEPTTLADSIRAFLPGRATQPPSHTGKTVLLVDDEPVSRKLLRLHLTQLGFSVHAVDPHDALDAARRHPPDLVVSDVLMPEVDGFELCLAIRRDPALAKIPVVLISAYYQAEGDEELARRVGASALVPRMPDLTPISDAVIAAIGEPPPVTAQTPSDGVMLAHARAVIRQFERQLSVNAGLTRRCTIQAAQLSLLGGIADALTRRGDIEVALRDVLAGALDAAAVSKGALFLSEPGEAPTLRHAIGFCARERAALSEFFGHLPWLEEVISGRAATSVPSSAVSPADGEAILDAAGVTSLEIVPLLSNGVGMGALVFGAESQDVTSEDLISFARAIGHQLVKSLELERSFRRVAASQKQLRLLMENANDAILLLDRDGTIREANRRIGELVGSPAPADAPRRPTTRRAPSDGTPRGFTPRGESGDSPSKALVGRRLADLGRTREAHARLEALVRGDAPREESEPTFELARANGEPLLMELSRTPVDVNDEVLVLLIGRDVTERMREHAQRMASDRMATIGMLAAGVAHEINNPLAAIAVNVEATLLALEDVAERFGGMDALSEVVAGLTDAREATDRVRDIVSDLRGLSRAETEAHTSLDVRDVLESTARMASNAIRHRARLVRDYDADLPLVRGSRSRLGQVFLNLMMNAAQAIDEGRAEVHEIRLRARGDDGRVIVEVEDTGHGIPEELLDELFTPFFTTKPRGEGTGLGLAICHRIVTELGGELEVESELGEGSLFRVILPAAREAEATEDTADTVARSPAPSTTTRARVLVIDDDPLVGRALSRTLSKAHDVTLESNARVALRAIESGARYDVIFCDLMMPAMTGMQLHAALIETAADQADRMIFITGGAFTAEARAFLERMADRRVDKPFELEHVRALVAEVARRATAPKTV
ncbi:MAG: response regulator [Myxococcales bacterium]|nr:response regulator [Myxococcales bacterium]